jgi:hypothetical protein
MPKKGKNSGVKKQANDVQTLNIPCFCYCCGSKVKIGQGNCSNPNCFSHNSETNFAAADQKYCAHCQKFVTIDVVSKRCLGCNHKLHGAIANGKKYTFH